MGAASQVRPVSTGRDGESERHGGVPEGHRRERLRVKTKRPRHFGRGPVSDKRLVLKSRGRESVAARRNGAQKKAPQEVYLMGGENPAATYSPGPEGQVPSAI